MTNTLVTVESIQKWLQEQVEQKLPIDAHTWIDASHKLLVLVGAEQEKLYDLQQIVSIQKCTYMETGDSVAKAKVKVESSDAFKIMQLQDAKVKNIFEMIRISKLRARMANEELKSY